MSNIHANTQPELQLSRNNQTNQINEGWLSISTFYLKKYLFREVVVGK